jgi:methionine aminopeptidase
MALACCGSRQKAIDFCKPGRAYKDIGAIIEEHITKFGYTTVK